MALGENMKIDKLIPEWKTVKEEINSDLNNSSLKDDYLKNVDSIDANESCVLSTNELQVPAQKYLEPIDQKKLKIAFNPSRRKATRRICIIIEGEFIVSNVYLLKNKVEEIFDNYDFIDIELKNIKQIDLAAIQLFQVLKNFYDAKEKSISVTADLNKEDKLLINKCGLAGLLTNNKLIN